MKQKYLILKWTVAILCLFAAVIAQAQVTRVDAIAITVKDMQRSVAFYHDVLGFEKVAEQELFGDGHEQEKGLFGIRFQVVRMQLGEEAIELTDYLTSGGRSIPEDARSNDLIFQHIAIVVSDMEKAYAQLRKHGVEQVSTAPQTIPKSNEAAAGVKAFYFHDPDGHNLELIYFPTGKGQAKWQQANSKLFLGIDHTAIGISNTEKSLAFYQKLLGLERKGESWNMGTEQAHLNFVEGASLHITGLRAAAGPGVEFLQYLKPGPGKAFPRDTKADDIWFWQTRLVVDNAQRVYEVLKKSGARMVSKGIVQLQDASGKPYKSFIACDPDGHAVQVLEFLET